MIVWALTKPIPRARAFHVLSDMQAAGASFDTATPAGVGSIRGFDDCAWLSDSNALNHGLARQEFAEAAYLYRLVRDLDAPRVVEIGRFKGGSTFLLAAAGARVLSLDVHEPQPGSDDALRRALEQFGLADRVEIVTVSSQSFELATRDPFQLVFFDVPMSYEEASSELARWWSAIASGGSLIVRDGSGYPETDPRAAIAEGTRLAAEDFGRRSDARRVATPGTYAHFVRVE
jgi:predicted O-methyltransferase YrrM